MTWVLGWPLRHEYAVQFAKKMKLRVTKEENVTEERLFLAASSYIGLKSGITDVLCCWEGDVLALVFGIYVDYRHRRYPPREVIRSELPPIETGNRLVTYLQTDDPPQWYRYDDGTYTPWDGELCGFSAEDDEYDRQEESKWAHAWEGGDDDSQSNVEGDCDEDTLVKDAYDEEEEQSDHGDDQDGEEDDDDDDDDEDEDEEEEEMAGVEVVGEMAHESNTLSSTFGTCGIGMYRLLNMFIDGHILCSAVSKCVIEASQKT